MKNLKLICLSLLTLFSSFLFAQEGPPLPKFKISYSNNSPKTGDIIEVIFQADILQGFHMYSTFNKCEIGPQKFELVFEKSSAYELVGKPYSIGDIKIVDDVFKCEVGEFLKKCDVRQKIKILSNDILPKGNVYGQWCNDHGECFSFDLIEPFLFSSPPLKATGAVIKKDELAEKSEKTIDTVAIVDKGTSPDSGSVPAKAEICETCNYKKKGSGDTAKCTKKTFNGEQSETDKENNWGLFILAFLSGLAGLLTPCVFPMIPMTVAFFLKDKKKKSKAMINGFFFGASIIAIYVVIGTITAFAFGADAGSVISTHWIPNVLFFLIFVVFAFSFFGAFEIVLPSGLTNKVDRQADKGGFYGIFFMALTLAVVSFSCTGPIVGSVLVHAAGGQFIRPVIAMLGFGLAFALPFSLFAIFPNWLSSLPKSGGWLNSVKVCFGFIELALGLKFLSTADQTYHWHILDREVYLCLWIVIFGLMGIYLLGKLKFSHDSELKFLKVPRLMMAIATLSFVIYMIPGLWGAPLKFLAGYLPPMSTQDFDINRTIRESQGLKGNMCKKPGYADQLHVPHGLNAYFDYDEAVACARELRKPLFIDFTGHSCTNCRKMEEEVWSDPRVLKIFNEEYVLASLYVDDKKVKLPPNEYFTGRFSNQEITMLGKKNSEIEICYFGKSSQPLYCLLDGNEALLQTPVGSEINDKQFDTEEFLKFLENGVAEYKKRNPVK